MTTIKLRRGTAAEWTSANPVLSEGEIGFEKDTNKHKIGDGVTAWNALSYFVNENTQNNSFVGRWQALRSYLANDIVLASDGTIIQRNATGTSRASYDTTEQALWTAKSGATTVPPATTSTAGKVRLATTVETAAGTASDRVITPASATAVHASGKRDLSRVEPLSSSMYLYGVVLAAGTTGAFDAGFIEGPCVWFDPKVGQLAMAYVGYDKISSDPTAVGSHGLAYSTDGITWTKQGQMFTASGVSGAPDQGGVTGPVVVIDNGVRHLFYIGLSAVGYEGGTKTICLATSPVDSDPAVSGNWTRQGAILSTGSGSAGVDGWRGVAVWHPNIVYYRGTWYLFANATGIDGYERCGYATASSLTGPWTWQDAVSPILPTTDHLGVSHATDKIWGGDPFIQFMPDHVRMDFARTDATATANSKGDFWATTSYDQFPLGWKVRGQVTSWANGEPFKPWVIYWQGMRFHYGTLGGVSLKMSRMPAHNSGDEILTGVKTFNQPSVGNGDSTVVFGTDIRANSGATGQARVNVGSSTADSFVVVGQGASNNLLLKWARNATAANAIASLSTWGGSNELQLQNNTGKVRVGGTGGLVGFYGTIPVSKPALTYSRATETAAAAGLRAALVTLGLVTDSTTA